MGSFYVYGLADPDTGCIKYVGQTRNIRSRPGGNYGAKVIAWRQNLVEQGKKPAVLVLHECGTRKEALTLEQREIDQLKPALNGKIDSVSAQRGVDKSAFLRSIRGREQEFEKYLQGNTTYDLEYV